MTYIINPWIFYWCGVLSNILVLTFIVGIVSACLLVGTLVYYFMFEIENNWDSDSQRNKMLKANIILSIFTMLNIGISILIPTKDTMYEMIVAEVCTQENMDTAKSDVKEIIDYAVDKIDEMKNSN